VELSALGSRIQRILKRREHSLAWTTSLTVTALPPFSLAVELTQRWLERYQAGDLDVVDLIYNSYQGMGSYQTQVTRVIPPQVPSMGERESPEVWPPPVLEADVLSLYGRVVEQWTMTRLYRLLLDSAAAEQSTRYQLMESATQNVDRLISELTLAVQAARRRQITREMQELAAGAGLVGPRKAPSDEEGASG
jgi:F-type H+-transporting ATPase subunit gamma